jgi:hypothetical protein
MLDGEESVISRDKTSQNANTSTSTFALKCEMAYVLTFTVADGKETRQSPQHTPPATTRDSPEWEEWFGISDNGDRQLDAASVDNGKSSEADEPSNLDDSSIVDESSDESGSARERNPFPFPLTYHSQRMTRMKQTRMKAKQGIGT